MRAQDSQQTVVNSPIPNTDAGLSGAPAPNQAIPAVPGNYLIGPTDLLEVYVYQMPDLTRQVRVASDGTIRLPMVAAPISAAGKTAFQVGADVAKILQNDGLANNPLVQVTVRQVMSRPVVVAGAVKTPIVLQAARPMSLLEVIARAGGISNNGGATAVVTSGTQATSYDLNQLMSSSHDSGGPLLTGGETVRVLPAKFIYAVGALQKPGAFPIQVGDAPTVLHVLALAQGFSTTSPAERKTSYIIRTQPNGSRTELSLNLEAILDHKAPDQLLHPGDILYVPENGKRKILTSVLADVGQAAVIAVGYNAHSF